MDRFLLQQRTRSSSLPRSGTPLAASQVSSMAAATHSPAVQQAAKVNGLQRQPGEEGVDEATLRIAREVAKIRRPTIVEAVEEAVRKSLHSMQSTLDTHAQRITDTEARVVTVEEEVAEVYSHMSHTDDTIKALWEKIDDLENRTRRNNLRIIGIPETYSSTDIMRICTKGIPEALGIKERVQVERTHHIGPYSQERKTARATIAAYLNYADKTLILQRFRNKRPLVVEDNPLLIFADYSAEVSKRRKAFNKICTELVERQIKFSLLYPAKLTFMAPNGRQMTFLDHEEAEAYIQQQGEGGPASESSPTN